jgi:hypothetical protein
VLEAYQYDVQELDKDAGKLFSLVENVKADLLKPRDIEKSALERAKGLLSNKDLVARQGDAIKSYNDCISRIKRNPSKLTVSQYEGQAGKLVVELTAASEIIGRIRDLVQEDQRIQKLAEPLRSDFHLSRRTEYQGKILEYEVSRKDLILREGAEYLRRAEWLKDVGVTAPILVRFYHSAADPSVYRDGLDPRASTPEAIKREFQAGVERLRKTEQLWHVCQQVKPVGKTPQLLVPQEEEVEAASPT